VIDLSGNDYSNSILYLSHSALINEYRNKAKLRKALDSSPNPPQLFRLLIP
jgi:hypothetical protein